MDTVEQGLLKLQQQKDEDIKKYQLLFAQSVFKVTEKSSQCSQNQARQFKKVFPELEDMVEDMSQKFNPHFVVEFVEGKPTQILRDGTWDKEEGLLPNRQLMDKYWVDVEMKMEGGEHFFANHNQVC